MATLISPAVSSLFRFKKGASSRSDTPTNLGKHSATPCDAETTGQRTNREKPVQTGLGGFLASSNPTWRQSVFRWFFRPVYAASSAAASEKTTKRPGYIGWEEYFMAIAMLSAKRSKDPVKQVGACIVNKDKKIVGTGYNGMPIGCSDDDMPWGKGSEKELENKHLFVCHAEMNAIVNKIEADVKGCTMHVTLFPCNECAKIIVQSGIKEVVYYSDEKAEKTEVRASKKLFDRAHVKYRPYKVKEKLSKMLIDFDDPSKNAEASVDPVLSSRPESSVHAAGQGGHVIVNISSTS